MKRKKILLGSIIIGAVLLSGCIDNSEPPPDYPSSNTIIDIQIGYEEYPDGYPIFYFGDVVQDNGSVNVSKTDNWTFTITNNGSQTEEVRFKIVDFPDELMIWSTELRLIDTEIIHIPEYDFDRERFETDCLESISPNSTVNITFSITFNKARAWSYNPDVSYVGRFELEYHVQKGNIYYDELVIPFVVRT
ncbi:unnamed protein product [marine sediment metagenome]|uniref:Uncharacterized protein n=1 Tax=marine sediment metagenome TaxID=412755 RepID=X0ZH90_9ZZZZ